MKVRRRKQSVINIVLSLLSQTVTVLVGMLLPRALMVNYGSETNGLITSMQQVINYLTLIEGGLLSTVAVALYKPIANEDISSVNQVLAAAKYFYRKTGVVFLAALGIVALIYPGIIAQTEFSYMQVTYMVLLIGVNGATQILFIGKYKALLMASQKNGIILSINALSTVLYSGMLIAAAYLKIDAVLGLTIAVSAYLLRSMAFYVSVKRFFPQYDFSEPRGTVSFPQRADALASQVLTMISLNGGTLILSFFKAPMEEISVYTTYNLVLSGLFMLMYSVENSMTSAFGDLLARDTKDKICDVYEKFDSIYHMLWAVIIACLGVLLLPFIRVYTIGVTDAEYILPVEGMLFTMIAAVWMLRNQQTLLMTAQGRFKDIRRSMMIEAIIVVVIGALGYMAFGLKGMLIAKLVGTLYMCSRLMVYNYREILHTNMTHKLQNILLSLVAIICTGLLMYFMPIDGDINLLNWVFKACCTFVISSIITIVIWCIFQKCNIVSLRIR